MLEDIGDILSVKNTIKEARRITGFIYNNDKVVNLMKTYTNGRDLLRPGITRFATEFVAMESLLRYATDLKRMCTSREWVEYNNTLRRRHEAGDISDMILNERFWKRVRRVCGVMEPLVKVLKVVDQDKKKTYTTYHLRAMDRVKMAIKTAVKDFQQYWDIIDERWYNQLHQDLYTAVYFLNPGIQYSGTCEFDSSEVRKGVKEVIKRLELDLDIQVKAMNEINTFVNKVGEFGSALAIRAVATSLPADWWNMYGDKAPNFRKIALKVLSQTCTSSGCERDWSTWSLIHTKLRNRLAIEKLHKLVYVHYNMRLRVKIFMQRTDTDDFYDPIDLNHIFDENDILDEWVRENESPLIHDSDLNWLDETIDESGDGIDSQHTSRYSGVHEHMQDFNIGYSYGDSSHNSSSKKDIHTMIDQKMEIVLKLHDTPQGIECASLKTYAHDGTSDRL
ncbi:uncharacterized protein LOC127263948 [Andrographis paniculata]|uniref:uncharacterized protein LOC127263948 n=1 Tax=Andrographis paniculata TaxID=175694 RepID=UPI0021E7B7EB|nr:uncharacterized protein LOC127263948 [Andrographis paniculata]